MRRLRMIAQAAAGAALLSLPATAQVSFLVIDDLPGGLRNTNPQAISTDGAVVVGGSHSASGTEAFRWTEAGGTVGLGALPGPEFHSIAMCVSADGSVIGGRSQAGGAAWIWTEAKGMQPLEGDSSSARSISYDGRVIAGNSLAMSGGLEATRWLDGARLTLGTLAPDGLSFGQAVSGDGRVVVGGTSVGVRASLQAFVWDEVSGMEPITDVAEGAEAFAVSADGSVVVGRASNVKAQSRGFRWTRDGGFEWITDISHGQRLAANGVSADGSVVVGGRTGYESETAFVWTRRDGVRDLRRLVEDRGVDLAGWTLVRAMAVSADGCVIVGMGQRIVDLNEGFVIRFWRRADLDRNGVVDFFDFLEFQNLFAAGDPRADFNGDGVLDFFDFLEFQAATEEECL